MGTKGLLAAILPFCFYMTQGTVPQTQQVVLRGDVITPTEVLSNGLVSIAGGKIDRVEAAAGQPRAWVETGSYIFPGLIDLHDHLTWNFLPRWKPNQLFNNRYEWQQTAAYKAALLDPHNSVVADHGLTCDADRFGEIKAIVGGATSAVGGLTTSSPNSQDNNCALGLVRNLDGYSDFNQEKPKVRYEVFPFEMRLFDTAQVNADLNSGALNAFLIHVGEGKASDAASAREFKMLFKNGDGFLRPGVSVIHGTAFGKYEFEQMAAHQVGLIWSPRSNIELYGSTTDVRTAKETCPALTNDALPAKKCVKIALAPDWSPSGSDGMLEELQYAAAWNASQRPPVFDDAELVKMATVVPAQLVGADKLIGSISKGLHADLLLIRKSNMTPYQALWHATPADVRLVMIGGLPVYGDQDLMERLLPGRQLESLVVCGTAKRLYIEPKKGIPETQKTFQQISEELKSKLATSHLPLAELAPCK